MAQNNNVLPSPEIRETIGVALHNAAAGIKLGYNAHNFTNIANWLGYREARFTFGPLVLHPMSYDPINYHHDLGAHIGGLTSAIVGSSFNPDDRAECLMSMVDEVSEPASGRVFNARGYSGWDVWPSLASTHVVRGFVRREIDYSIEREEHRGPTEHCSDLQQVRALLSHEWCSGRHAVQATALAVVGIIAARRLRRA